MAVISTSILPYISDGIKTSFLKFNDMLDMQNHLILFTHLFSGFVIGLVNIALSLVIDKIDGSIFKLTLVIDAMLTSPKAGVFILGVLSPVVDTMVCIFVIYHQF